jgi:hypothetical protein
MQMIMQEQLAPSMAKPRQMLDGPSDLEKSRLYALPLDYRFVDDCSLRFLVTCRAYIRLCASGRGLAEGQIMLCANLDDTCADQWQNSGKAICSSSPL